MIEFKDPFGRETSITILPVPFNGKIHFAVDSKYKYVAVWDVQTAKKILMYLEGAITSLEEREDNAK